MQNVSWPSLQVLYPNCIVASSSGPRYEGPVVIRRPAHTQHTRTLVVEDMDTDDQRGDALSSSQSNDVEDGGMSKIRQLLFPPPIDGLTDWGIPAELTEPCDAALEV
jgi:hypothetical protein